MNTPPSNKDSGSAPPLRNKPSWLPLVMGIPFLLLGGAIIWQASGGTELFGRALVPAWVLGLAGLAFFCAGLTLVLPSFGITWAGSLAGAVIPLSLVAMFNYSVFVGDLSAWSGTRIGSLSAGHVTRIVVVAVDLFIVLGWILHKTTFDQGKPGPIWKRFDEKFPPQGFQSERRMIGMLVLLVPLLLAVTLHYAGVLDRIGAAFGQRSPARDRPPAYSVARPFEQFAGSWKGAHSAFGEGWITRLSVRLQDQDAYVNFWHACRQGDCDEGEFKATVRGKIPREVNALEVMRTENGLTRTVRLTPDARSADWLMISESRIRGQDWSTHQQNVSGLRRASQ